jgi:hypothetical protein
MAKTYDPIQTQTLGSAVASVTFSSIPATYTDLVLVYAGVIASGGEVGLTIRFNGDSGSNYSKTDVVGNGSAASSARDSNYTEANIGLASSTVQANSIFHIMNYANTTTNKTVLARGNNSAGYVRLGVGLWRSTAAITSVTLIAGGSVNFNIGTVATLYGIKSA